MARNYSKRTRRYAVGGIVPKEKDGPYYDPLKDYDAIDQQRELELEENRNKMLHQGPPTDDPEDTDYVDPNWREHMPEDT